jgi:hypothetical protein
MSASQREIGEIVIEICRCPFIRIVAENAICWKSGRRVIRIFRGGIVVLVASNTRRCCPGVSTRVASIARHFNVGAGQRECRQIVVQLHRRPYHSGVAFDALRREPRRNVVRVGCVVEVRLMARNAVCGCSGVCRCVAVVARGIQVAACQRESRRVNVG